MSIKKPTKEPCVSCPLCIDHCMTVDGTAWCALCQELGAMMNELREDPTWATRQSSS